MIFHRNLCRKQWELLDATSCKYVCTICRTRTALSKPCIGIGCILPKPTSSCPCTSKRDPCPSKSPGVAALGNVTKNNLDLFGIFDVTLHLQYGEVEKAFGKLPVELIRLIQYTGLLNWIGKRLEQRRIFPAGHYGFRDAALPATAVSYGSSMASSQIYPSCGCRR
ncbi:hypothetical protein F5J12DRAFT_843079 [Pisolithus orientalis]|uniref:uncharacterized protein n=1 Tax=Pisolithus orientalis TaxID=936130 RepID=UPI0022259606|nr:uncharacterized protein F5J12DRAFT_843079 [Pisolithus orientalis]KAI6001577.1 hypothetical protein F5J12DRAFT_843079 [Pisolithus orientalis]